MLYQEHQKANSLDEAGKNWIRGIEITPDSPFFVPRPDKTLDELILRLNDLSEQEFSRQKIFLSGQGGTGKSTTFLALKKDSRITDHYYVFLVPVFEYGALTDVKASDILFLIATTLASYVEKYGNQPPEEVVRETNAIVELIKKALEGAEWTVGVNIGLIQSSLKTPLWRTKIREWLVRPDPILNHIERLAHAVRKQENKLPLLLIDDLDKASLEMQIEIFGQDRESLFRPQCPIIYTFNHALTFESAVGQIRDRDKLITGLCLGKTQTRHRQYFVDVISRRMDVSLIKDDALNDLVTLSGGLLGQLRHLMYEAILSARTEGCPIIRAEDVRKAARGLANSLTRLLNDDDEKLLRQTIRAKRLAAEYQKLISISALIECVDQDGNPSVGPNPVLKEFLI